MGDSYRAAICSILPGLNVPSVSMYMALPSPPPSVVGSCKDLLVTNSSRKKQFIARYTLWRLVRTWQVTHSVCIICVFPLRFSPYTSVMVPVSKPPSRISSNSLQPVDTLIMSPRIELTTLAVVKPIGTRLKAAHRPPWCGCTANNNAQAYSSSNVPSFCILSTFAELRPLMFSSSRLGAWASPSTVCIPALWSFWMSLAEIPKFCKYKIFCS